MRLSLLKDLLRTASWAEFKLHPARYGVAAVAIALGVALGLAVQLINTAALADMGRAVRSVNGEPDVSFKSSTGTGSAQAFQELQFAPGVDVASPVLELRSMAVLSADQANRNAPDVLTGMRTARMAVKVLGTDVLSAPRINPALVPKLATSADAGQLRFALFAADAVFINDSARAVLGTATTVNVQVGMKVHSLRIAGSVGIPGSPALLMDVAAAQALFEQADAISRVDVKLLAGTSAEAWLRTQAPRMQALGFVASTAEDSQARLGEFSRAYRVNLSVLALVALFVGGYLVFSVLALGVAQRSQQLALLATLGLTQAERERWVLAEAAVLGVLGSAVGVVLGIGLTQLALGFAGGDLGGGYFSGGKTGLALKGSAYLAVASYFGLGVVAALAGAWWPARTGARIAPAQGLKGMGLIQTGPQANKPQLLMLLGALLSAAALAFAPSVGGVALGAYVAVGLLLVAGIGLLPLALGTAAGALARWPWVQNQALGMLAISRAQRVQHAAAVATSGVVASLALSAALTIMVASFRDSVMRWLDVALPAPLYVRSAAASGSDGALLDAQALQTLANSPSVAEMRAQRIRSWTFDAAKPPITVIAFDLNASAPREQALSKALDWVGAPLVTQACAATDVQTQVPVYVSEAMLSLHGAKLGAVLPDVSMKNQGMPSKEWTFLAMNNEANVRPMPQAVVCGVWRDYARQHGTIAMARSDYVQITGDALASDASIWPKAGVTAPELQSELRAALESQRAGAGQLVEFASAQAIRSLSLKIFDRSFAVTVWLQAVAIGIGLFGVAASLSAQVVARRKEFGLLAHLGLTKSQILRLISLEALVWTAVAAVWGLVLGVLVALILVHVVNPQSFHWTMDLVLPTARLGALAAAVVLAGYATAWLAGRAAASAQAVQAVKEDW
jgi:putative ABC transport system permease protein